jgi:hypothetical protein
MTASALAIVSDQRINGEPVIGYAFDSIGRYGKGGLLRERFIPRVLAAPPDTLLDSDGIIDPDAVFTVLMRNEKDGGHGERPGAVGLIDAAAWDLRLEGLPDRRRDQPVAATPRSRRSCHASGRPEAATAGTMPIISALPRLLEEPHEAPRRGERLGRQVLVAKREPGSAFEFQHDRQAVHRIDAEAVGSQRRVGRDHRVGRGKLLANDRRNRLCESHRIHGHRSASPG